MLACEASVNVKRSEDVPTVHSKNRRYDGLGFIQGEGGTGKESLEKGSIGIVILAI